MADRTTIRREDNNNGEHNNLTYVRQLSNEAPAFVARIYEAGDYRVMAVCNKENSAPLGYYFESKGISHSPVSQLQMNNPYNENHIQPLPLHTDFYSSALGRRVPARSTIPTNHWFSNTHNEPLTHSALQEAGAKGGMEVMVNIGPQTIMNEHAMHVTGNRNLKVLESITNTEDELKTLKRVQDSLAGCIFFQPPLH